MDAIKNFYKNIINNVVTNNKTGTEVVKDIITNHTSSLKNHTIKAVQNISALLTNLDTEPLNNTVPLNTRRANSDIVALMSLVGVTLSSCGLLLILAMDVIDRYFTLDAEVWDPEDLMQVLYCLIFSLMLFSALMIINGTPLRDAFFPKDFPG